MTAKKPIAPADNESNMRNGNKGTPGTNLQYDQATGNRGKQMDPKQQPPVPGKKGG